MVAVPPAAAAQAGLAVEAQLPDLEVEVVLLLRLPDLAAKALGARLPDLEVRAREALVQVVLLSRPSF